MAAGTVAYGAYSNKKAADTNASREAQSRADYADRLKAAAVWAKQLGEQYNEIVGERPDISWESFVQNHIRAIDDPILRQAYTEAKAKDYEMLRTFASQASDDNVDNLERILDDISGGQWAALRDKRNELVMETDAQARMARAFELSAPVRSGASTVRYDSQGRLVEGQRADKQAFTVAQEVQTAVEQEQKQDIRQLQSDYTQVALSQQQRATDFMGFFDATGQAISMETNRSALEHGYQAMDEQRAFDMFKMFAGASAGTAPVQPLYQDTGVGNQLISSGLSGFSSSVSAYGNQKK